MGASPGKLRLSYKEGDMIIAADGGYDCLAEMGITPHWVVGDFDSVSGRKAPEVENLLTFPVEKDFTDSALAAKLGEEKGFTKFIFHRCAGGAIDHTLANIAQIYDMSKRGLRGILLQDDTCLCAVCDSGIVFREKAIGRISVFSLSERSEGVSITGLHYELSNYTLESRVPLGVSNEFTGKGGSISVKNGALLICTGTDNVLRYSDYFA